MYYLLFNLMRNLRGALVRLPTRRWRPPESVIAQSGKAAYSPSRLLSEGFIREQLPRILDPARIDVLDIGCGSGYNRCLLEDAGYSGTYTGIDVANRF